MDFADPEREKEAFDIEVDIIETLACVASVSLGLGFFVRSKHFSLFGRAKIGASAKEVGEGAREGRKKMLALKPQDFEKHFEFRTFEASTSHVRLQRFCSSWV